MTKPNISKIYKIEDRDIWEKAMEAGIYTGSSVDLADGFIHFSTASQSRETAARHFANRENLILATIDVTALGENLKWETSRGGALFPHLYAPLAMENVLAVVDLPLDAMKIHQFPKNFGTEEQ